MISQAMQDAINEQINMELHSAYIYLGMAGHFESTSLGGFAHWMRLQAQEELGHAMRLFEHINDRGGRVVLKAIPAPPSDYGAPVEIFQAALDHERAVSRSIHELYGLATAEQDYAAQVALQWFIGEQVEEEKSAGDVVDQLRMIGDNRSALVILDHQLGARDSAD